MYIIHLGTSGFPTGTNAVIQRIRLTFKGLKYAGCNPLIINKNSLYQTVNKKRINRYQGIPFISTAKLLNRPNNFLIRNLNRISGYTGELILLFKKRKSIHTAILYGYSFSELIYYRILSKLLQFQLILQYVEFYSSIKSRKKFFMHLDDLLLDNYRFYFCDGIIVISEFLKNHTLSKNNSLPIIKIPVICDFEEFNRVQNIKQREYLMYCGSIAYLPVIEFVIDLYIKLRELNTYQGKLYLAIGVGDKNEESLAYLTKRIKDCKFSDCIIFKTNISYLELIKKYLEAELLIVPMRNTLQDIAGFHHKIGEYCAARRPIISTNLGELSHYFEDGISAILADEYTIESYVQMLAEKLPFKEKLNLIANEGFKVGYEKLNYLSNGVELGQFIIKNKKRN